MTERNRNKKYGDTDQRNHWLIQAYKVLGVMACLFAGFMFVLMLRLVYDGVDNLAESLLICSLFMVIFFSIGVLSFRRSHLATVLYFIFGTVYLMASVYFIINNTGDKEGAVYSLGPVMFIMSIIPIIVGTLGVMHRDKLRWW